MIYLIAFDEDDEICYYPFKTKNGLKKYLLELKERGEDVSDFLVIDGEKLDVEEIIK